MPALPISEILEDGDEDEDEDDKMDEWVCKLKVPSGYRPAQSTVDESLKRPCDFV